MEDGKCSRVRMFLLFRSLERHFVGDVFGVPVIGARALLAVLPNHMSAPLSTKFKNNPRALPDRPECTCKMYMGFCLRHRGPNTKPTELKL